MHCTYVKLPSVHLPDLSRTARAHAGNQPVGVLPGSSLSQYADASRTAPSAVPLGKNSTKPVHKRYLTTTAVQALVYRCQHRNLCERQVLYMHSTYMKLPSVYVSDLSRSARGDASQWELSHDQVFMIRPATQR